jgi:hypothetical protein
MTAIMMAPSATSWRSSCDHSVCQTINQFPSRYFECQGINRFPSHYFEFSLSLPLKLDFDNSQFVPLTRVISRWLLLILRRLGGRAAQSTLPNNFGITGGSALLQLSNSRELLSPLGGQECPRHMMVNICAKGLPSANQLPE